MKYAGIVVTYNRKEELINNLNSIVLQKKKFDKYYIIDNCSSDGTYEFLVEQNILKNEFIKYILLDKNIGGAGGFYTGLRFAYEDGYDFICMMDDDGRPLENETFLNLYNTAKEIYKNHKKMMLNSLVVCDDNAKNLSFGLGTMRLSEEVYLKSVNNLIKDLINPFNGTLVSKELVEEIGFPNKDFFIRGDEVDYQSRAKKADAFIATVVNSMYYHPSAELVPLRWRGRTVYIGTYSPWKGYYLVRNYVFRIKRDSGNLAAIKEFI